MNHQNQIIPYADIERMGNAIAKSKLFGLQTAEQAVALMLIAQAEGLHPAIAARDYHIIQGKPALKADAILSRFQQAGGRVEWHEVSDKKADATFTHAAGGSVRLDWDIARAKAADLGTKDMWRKYPRQMLRSRLISEGVRTVYPAVLCGVYTPEEVEDMAPDRPAPVVQPAVVVEPSDCAEYDQLRSELCETISTRYMTIGIEAVNAYLRDPAIKWIKEKESVFDLHIEKLQRIDTVEFESALSKWIDQTQQNESK